MQILFDYKVLDLNKFQQFKTNKNSKPETTAGLTKLGKMQLIQHEMFLIYFY